MQKFKLKCIKCGAQGEGGEICDCNKSPYYNYYYPIYDYEGIAKRKEIDWEDYKSGLSKYLPLLPNQKLEINLGEGNTPIVELKNFANTVGLYNLYVKNETFNPTGCFKDRESAVIINYALEKHQRHLVICSSGNAAVSAAAYSNIVNIPCECYVPRDISAGKQHLLEYFGASINKVNGYYESIYKKVADKFKDDDSVWNITSGITNFREEGNKTIAFEIFEDMGVPDTIVVPVGNGSLFVGIYKGFWELLQMGLIEKLPKMIAVQINGHSPVAEAIKQGVDFVHLEALPKSIAEGGIAAQDSFCLPKLLVALNETNGEVIEITDEDLLNTLKKLAKLESFLVEPTSLAPFAALDYIKKQKDEKIICIATGSAFKNLPEVLRLLKGGLK